MRYLGQLAVAAQVASRAGSNGRATTEQPLEDLPEAPGLPDDRAAAWRAWAGAGAREVQPRPSTPHASTPDDDRRPSAEPAGAPRRIRDHGLVERRERQAGLERMAGRELIPARRRFIEWMAQIVDGPDPEVGGAGIEP
jgi:hypothetical protein